MRKEIITYKEVEIRNGRKYYFYKNNKHIATIISLDGIDNEVYNYDELTESEIEEIKRIASL